MSPLEIASRDILAQCPPNLLAVEHKGGIIISISALAALELALRETYNWSGVRFSFLPHPPSP